MRWHLNQEKTIPYQPRKSRQKEIDLPLGSFDTEDSYHPMNDDYEEPVVIDEDELDEEVLREMMDEDDYNRCICNRGVSRSCSSYALLSGW